MAVQEDSEAPMFYTHGVAAYPGFAVTEKHNDNILRSDANKQSSLITVLSPSVLVQGKSGANVYSLTYNADIGRYASSSADNFEDQNLSGVAELSFSTRASAKIAPMYQIGHDDRGAFYSPLTATPNTWHKSGIGGSFTYGSDESIGRIVLEASTYDIRYQNNREITTAFDRSLDDVAGSFYYRAAPKVFTFVQLGDTRIAYRDSASPLSGHEERAMVGATWNATAQTTGSFKIGQLRKKFDSSQMQTFTGSSWEGKMRWSPVEFARLDLVSSRRTYETTGIGSFVLNTYNGLDFGYDVSQRTTVHVTASRLTEEFGQTDRVDTTPAFGLKGEYKLRKWLKMGAEYARAVKSSTGFTGTSPEYHQNIFAVNIHSEL